MPPYPSLRLQVFSIVVFGSIVNEGYLNTPLEGEEFCIYNRNPNACSYGVTVGVLTFITCLLYLALDVYFPQISSVKDRKKAVLSDIGVSGEPPPQSPQRAVPALVPLIPTHTSQAGEGTGLGVTGLPQGSVGPVLACKPSGHSSTARRDCSIQGAPTQWPPPWGGPRELNSVVTEGAGTQ